MFVEYNNMLMLSVVQFDNCVRGLEIFIMSNLVFNLPSIQHHIIIIIIRVLFDRCILLMSENFSWLERGAGGKSQPGLYLQSPDYWGGGRGRSPWQVVVECRRLWAVSDPNVIHALGRGVV